jgi:IclR family transcriptional regulator, KDG regulon repressor
MSNPPKAYQSKYISTTIVKSLQILDLFKGQPRLSFADIQAHLGLNKSTLFRILYTLEANNYLSRDETGKYALGLNIFILGNSFSRENHLKRVATPYLHELSVRSSMTVQLGVLEGTTAVILQKVDPLNSLKMFSRVGAVLPAHCTAQGKTLLAFSPKERVEQIINVHGLQRFTPTTITTAAGLFEDLRAIRARGYSVDDAEHEKNIKCIGVPILNEQGDIEAALSVTALVIDFPDEQTIDMYVDFLRATAAKIRKDLGFG